MGLSNPQSAIRNRKSAIGMLRIVSWLQFQEGVRVGPLPLFPLKFAAFVHDDLPVLAQGYPRAFERPGSRTLEVDAALVIPASVTRALELLFRGKPVRRAAEVGAYGDERIHDVVLAADDPDSILLLEALGHFAWLVQVRLAGSEDDRMFTEYLA